MSMDNYDNFKAAVVRFTGRNDISDIVDDAIIIADAQIYANEKNPLRLKFMETRSTASADTATRFLALPDGFLHMRRLKINNSLGDTDIRYRTPEQLPLHGDSGMPRFFTVTSQLELDRTPDSAYELEMQFYARIDIISSTNTTNHILTNYPNIYLYGVLSVVYQFAAEEEKSQYYNTLFINSIAGANFQDQRGRYGSSPIQRVEGSTP